MTAVARIPGYDPLEMGFTKKESRRFAKFVQYGIIAADEAMAQANFDLEAEDLTVSLACSVRALAAWRSLSVNRSC